MKLENIKNIYFVGIGGIGMSALARYCLHHKMNVFGYDKIETELSKSLENEGANIIYQDDQQQLPISFSLYSEDNIVVYTPAIPQQNHILTHLKNLGYTCYKRAELLGFISQNHFTIAVAGTHGKTTTSCLLAHLCQQAGFQFTAILGGLSTNLKSNYYSTSEGQLLNDKSILVTEADEFDRSFLYLSPEIAIITSTDADHLDVYDTEQHIQQSYQAFAELVKDTLILNSSADIQHRNTILYGLKTDHKYENISIYNGEQYFDYSAPQVQITNIKAGLPGEHNVENATAVIAAAKLLNVEDAIIKKSIASYTGVKRRFEKIVNQDEYVVIDDYAHHPTELKALITSIKKLYQNQKITLIFQPHLFSRTRDFMHEFAEELNKIEELILMPIYPAREKPIENINSSTLLHLISVEHKQILKHEEILEFIKSAKPKLLVTAGAGDISLLRDPIIKIYNGRK
jgi:UDP-N-acetylmuramate--alanine ligase